MEMQDDVLVVNGIKYVPENSINAVASKVDGMQYCIVRCDRSGVFAGYVSERAGREVVVKKARRLWKWSGAASLSQLSQNGTSAPSKCKFPMEMPEVVLLDAIEIIPASEKARKSIASVPVWKA